MIARVAFEAFADVQGFAPMRRVAVLVPELDGLLLFNASSWPTFWLRLLWLFHTVWLLD